MADQTPAPGLMARMLSTRTGRKVLGLMLGDDVNIGDEQAMQAWLEGNRPGQFDAFSGRLFDPDAALTWYAADLKEELGLTGGIAPVRLPSDDELRSPVFDAPLMSGLQALARAVRDEGEAGEADPLTAAVAAACQFTEVAAGGAVKPGPRVDWIASFDLGDLLTTWQYVFAHTLDAAVPGSSGTPLVLQLFRGPKSGLPAAALAGPDPEVTGRLLHALELIGAVAVTGGTVTLEPLGRLAVSIRLEACGVFVVRLTPDRDLTASEVVMLAGPTSGQDVTGDIAAELDAWVDKRTPAGAARELLAFAAGEEALVRLHATMFVSVQLGASAEGAWREALATPQLAGYAKKMLTMLALYRHPARPLPEELFLTVTDGAFLTADACSMTARMLGPDTALPLSLADHIGQRLASRPRELCAAIARLPRPDARAALVMLGRSEDSKLARAAREAAARVA